jgi:phage tail protein X
VAETTYITKQDDALDYICWHHYGYSSGAVEAVLLLEANAFLMSQPVKLPFGLEITLPDLSQVRRMPVIKIWDL